MGIFNRITTLFSAEANQALDAMEDPIAMIDQGLRELKKNEAEAIGGLAQIKAQAIRLRNEANQQKLRSDDYMRKAEALLLRGQAGQMDPREAERLATEAANLYETANREAEATGAAAAQQQQAADALQAKVNTLRSQVAQYETERKTLIARLQAANSTAKINQQLAGVDSSGTVAMLERMKARVAEKESLSQAYGEIADRSGGVDGEIDKALAGSPPPSAALLALKARLGLPSGEAPALSSGSQQAIPASTGAGS
ncbi:MAG: phage shock protein PspA [Gemmatimonadetes bacterium]|nr:phage shock protein PspA [Gemmatimonadota bacterium]